MLQDRKKNNKQYFFIVYSSGFKSHFQKNHGNTSFFYKICKFFIIQIPVHHSILRKVVALLIKLLFTYSKCSLCTIGYGNDNGRMQYGGRNGLQVTMSLCTYSQIFDNSIQIQYSLYIVGQSIVISWLKVLFTKA